MGWGVLASGFASATGPVALAASPVAAVSPVLTETPVTEAEIKAWCDQLSSKSKSLKWDVDFCQGIRWEGWGKSILGRPLVYASFGDPNAKNTTLILSMVHGDETTPLYLGLKLAQFMRENEKSYPSSRVVIAPLVNPDGFYRHARTNERRVDVNRNLPTADWEAQALKLWKTKFGKAPRRFPGHKSASEPETHFQMELIKKVRPSKILSIHAPLNFMDYDGPSSLTLARFPKEYIQECLKLRARLKAVSGGFFPGSLGNYAGQELGIPTLTLELPTADSGRADQYWQQFKEGIRTMIEFAVPEIAVSSSVSSGDT